ncbi:MAG: metallophosphoesterase family protein [Phycisphaeraceae bacterium]
MNRQTLVISDTHLGRPGKATAEMLQPLWQGVDELIINGDAAEVQIPWLRSAAVRELDRLEALTQREGVKLTLISGNHDAYLTDRRCLRIGDGRALVMHGDALHEAVAPWTPCAPAMRRLTRRAYEDTDPADHDDLQTRLAIAQHVGHSEFLEEYVLSNRGESGLLRALLRPWEIPAVLWYWRREPQLAKRFLDTYAPESRVLILGHSHRAGVWRLGDYTIINTGAFVFPGRPWCAVFDGPTLRLHRVIKRDGRYRRDTAARFECSDEAFDTGKRESVMATRAARVAHSPPTGLPLPTATA